MIPQCKNLSRAAAAAARLSRHSRLPTPKGLPPRPVRRAVASLEVPSLGGIVCSSARSFSSATTVEFPSQTPCAAPAASTDPSALAGEAAPHISQVDVQQLVGDLSKASAWNHGQVGKSYDETLWNPDFCRRVTDRYDLLLSQMSRHENIANMLPVDKQLLLSAETVIQAFKALLKCRYDPDELGARVRDWERCIGLLKSTPLTDPLSLRLLEANGKAGNVGRVLSLLHLRKARQYPAVRREFVYAVTSLQAANWAARRQRNIFVGDREQAAVDNPIRWLDAIMLNMHERDYPLTVHLANRMLQTFAAGKTGKAVHHFYRVVRHALETLPTEEQPAVTDSMPHVWADGLQNYKYQPVKVRLKYNAASPPFYKVPATVKGKMLFSDTDKRNGQFKLERESDPEWSLALTAAFAFTESLQHGACGHDGITLNRGSYNALVKACCHRGAMWRALKLLDTDMVQDDNTTPNIVTYNHILGGLARVGDVVTAQEYYKKLLNAGLEPNAFTVRAIVDGLLNLGDLPAAVTVVQDFFNQHNVLPPYTTHIKILEFCLARDMIYEAKRYVYFVQQLWKWEPNKYHSEQFIKLMHATQRNTQLQKPALQQLFAYFGETLEEKDFL